MIIPVVWLSSRFFILMLPCWIKELKSAFVFLPFETAIFCIVQIYIFDWCVQLLEIMTCSHYKSRLIQMKSNKKLSKYSFLETIFKLYRADVASISKCLLSSISNIEDYLSIRSQLNAYFLMSLCMFNTYIYKTFKCGLKLQMGSSIFWSSRKKKVDQ